MSAVSISLVRLVRKCAANSFNSLALVLISEGIRFTSSMKDVIAPRMTSQEALVDILVLAMVSCEHFGSWRMKK